MLALKLDCQYAIKMLIIQGKRSFAIFTMSCIVRIINNLPKINWIECFWIQTLARDISYWDENAVAITGMRNLNYLKVFFKFEILKLKNIRIFTYTSYNFRLTVAYNDIFAIWNIIKCNSAHCATKANMLRGQIKCSYRVSKSCFNQLFEYNFRLTRFPFHPFIFFIIYK